MRRTLLLLAASLTSTGAFAQAAGHTDAAPPTANARDALQHPSPPLGAGPWTFDTAQQRIRVSVVTAELVRPFGLAFLPNGDMLVTELAGRLRLVHDGKLDPTPIAGVPAVHAVVASGLKDVALHPSFAATRLVYLIYVKGRADGARG